MVVGGDHDGEKWTPAYAGRQQCGARARVDSRMSLLHDPTLRMRQHLLAALVASLCLGAGLGAVPALANDSAASLAQQALADCETGRQSRDRTERERLFV